MAGQTLLWDSRVRTIAFVLPALGVVGWCASQMASEEFLVPVGILAVFSVLVVFTTFVKTIRFESVILCMLLVGYLVGNRGFAELAPVKPLYPGEIAMSLIVICLLLRFAISRELPDFSGWVARVIFLYCVLGLLRLALDYNTYKLDAIRDSALVYYSVYYFFGRQLVSGLESKLFLERCLKYAFVALLPLAVIERFLPSLNWLDNGAGYSLLYQKDDIMTTFAAAAVFILYTRPKIYRWNWIRVSMILFYMILVVTGEGRASLAGLIVGSALIFFAGKKRFFLYPVFALILGMIALGALFAMGAGTSGAVNPALLAEKVTSMVDFSSNGSYNSAYGVQKAGTNDFRRKLWATFIDETNAYSPWFGRGFGYNFVVSFEEVYRLSGPGNLRSAHNFYVTLYGRMGLMGIAVFAALTMQIIVGGLRCALAVKAGRQPLADLGYWCSLWVILVSSAVGVVLEGPMAAIPFWTFLGVAIDSNQAAALAHRATEARKRALDFLPVLPEHRSPAYGIARTPVSPSR